MRNIFVTGIGTDVGKTVVSAILAEALEADYWKPVQTGNYFSTDTGSVRNLLSNQKSKIHPEVYSLKQNMSPHSAAAAEGVSIELSHIKRPETTNTIIMEGAGGIMVPLNNKEFVFDIIKKFDAETILVIRNYLGSINHSLLSIDVLKLKNIKILGVVFNGAPEVSEDIILNYSGLKCLGRVLREDEINKKVILKYAQEFGHLKN